MLFDVLEAADVATACGAVDVLRKLHAASPTSLEATVLECPAGMQRLLDILAPTNDDEEYGGVRRQHSRCYYDATMMLPCDTMTPAVTRTMRIYSARTRMARWPTAPSSDTCARARQLRRRSASPSATLRSSCGSS